MDNRHIFGSRHGKRYARECVSRPQYGGIRHVHRRHNASGKKDKTVALVVAVSMAASLVFSLIPALEAISGGVKVIILTVAISLAAAVIFPVENKRKKGAVSCEA